MAGFSWHRDVVLALPWFSDLLESHSEMKRGRGRRRRESSLWSGLSLASRSEMTAQ